MTDKKSPHSPLRLSTENNTTSLLGAISESEMQTLLNLRAFPCDLREGLQKTIATTAQRYAVTPKLKLVTVSAAFTHGGNHD